MFTIHKDIDIYEKSEFNKRRKIKQIFKDIEIEVSEIIVLVEFVLLLGFLFGMLYFIK